MPTIVRLRPLVDIDSSESDGAFKVVAFSTLIAVFALLVLVAAVASKQSSADASPDTSVATMYGP